MSYLYDDTIEIRIKLINCDGIVVGSPVYSGEPTAQLKTLISKPPLKEQFRSKYSSYPHLARKRMVKIEK